MDIAQNKRRENIAEYILYLWQLEDLLRSLQLSPEAIYSQLIAPRGLDPDRQQEILLWYMDIVNLLRQEGKEESGHLEHTLHLIRDLQDLHEQLMVLPVGENYRQVFRSFSPELPRLREILGNKNTGEIEIAFRTLYAVMLYRLKGHSKADAALQDALETVSPVLAELSAIYHKVEKGEIDLFENKG